MKFKKVIILFLVILSFSCSLNYGNQEESEDLVPEFDFSNATFKRFSEGKVSVVLNASNLEQYKSDSSSFAKNVEFQTFNKTGQIETSGSCEYLSGDINNELYYMFNNVKINNFEQDLIFNTQSLFFNGKNEQLVCSNDDDVFITKKGTSIHGKGFSASALSNSYSFNQQISGIIEEENQIQNEETDSSNL